MATKAAAMYFILENFICEISTLTATLYPIQALSELECSDQLTSQEAPCHTKRTKCRAEQHHSRSTIWDLTTVGSVTRHAGIRLIVIGCNKDVTCREKAEIV